jgi:hypothetical protein
LEKGTDSSPIQHWTQGLARMGQAALGGWDLYKTNEEDKASRAEGNKLLSALLGGSAPAISPEPQQSQPMPQRQSLSAPMGNLPPMLPSASAQPQPAPVQTASLGDAPVAPQSQGVGPFKNATGASYVQSTPLGGNIQGLSPKAQQIVAALGNSGLKDMSVVSSYRDPSRNAAVGGAKGSRHMSGDAIDLDISKLNDEQKAQALQYAIAGGAKGIGIYPSGRSLHVDARDTPTVWGSNPAGTYKGHDPSLAPKWAQGPLASLYGGASTPRPPQTVPPTQVAQATPQTATDAPAGVNPQLLQAMMGNRYTAPVAQGIAGKILEGKFTSPKPTDEMREYNMSRQQGYKGSFMDYKTELKKAGAIQNQVMIDQKGEGEFSKEAGKLQAKRFDELASDGPAANQMLSDVQTLQSLGTLINTGKGAEFKAALGPYAEALGVKIDGLPEAQAYNAIVTRVAPTLRVKGSGAQSDYELKSFLKSLPSLGNTPEGNAIVSKTLEGLYQNKLTAAEIGAKALSREITPTQAETQLRQLPDRMKEYREFIKKAPAAPQAAPAKPADEGVTVIDGIKIRKKN